LQELEVMADPTRREVETIRKRVDKLNRQLKPLGKNCLKKVKPLLIPFRSTTLNLCSLHYSVQSIKVRREKARNNDWNEISVY
jgi:hypothetical protein